MTKLIKPLCLCIIVFGLYLSSTANPVELQTAQSVAAKFMGTNDLQLSATYRTSKNIAAFYVFNTADGFVIVSADDCETPIIGYSHEGRFDPNNVPVQMVGYLQDFVDRIQYGIENQIVADEVTARQWQLVKATGQLNGNKAAKSVGPLLTDKWNQGCRYNSLCPEMGGPCGHAEAGCVAIAMAQIMHYWGYPTIGWGSHSYSNAGEVLSANFGNTTYDWEHMPDSLTENSSEAEIEAVATLIYHCGVAVKMNYGINGSLADHTIIADAMLRYFSYSKRVHREKLSDYGNEEWMSLLKNNLDQQQPILYVAYGSGGHAFVCDGYDDNNLFHFNWGWGGNGNGYYAIGNLNPIGYNFNDSNSAIIDIIPQYEPYQVNVPIIPATAGSVEGCGEYHHGEQCTLTAIPTENSTFHCWKRNGQIVAFNPTYTFEVLEDINNLEANFSLPLVKQIEACCVPDSVNPNDSCVSLTWIPEDTQWNLLKQFANHGEKNVATDGEFLYTSYYDIQYSNPVSFAFGKYTLDGDLVEFFSINDYFYVPNLTYDGNYFYCKNNYAGFSINEGYKIYCVDLANKRIIDSISTSIEMRNIAYDPDNDGFWLVEDRNLFSSKLALVNRQGQRIVYSPNFPFLILGFGYIKAKDGSPHLLLMGGGRVYDYDITARRLNDYPLMTFDDGNTFSVNTGKYDGKDAMFVTIDSTVRIYEIRSTLSQITGYRIYRADNNEHTTMLAEDVSESSFIDSTWKDALAGLYRYGISSVFSNGVESEIIWSDFIEKTNFAIDENIDHLTDPTVQKVIENGHIVIIKDGKRYTMMGQELK